MPNNTESLVHQVAHLLADQPAYCSVDLRREDYRHLNPKFSMVARAFINWLRDETVRARLQRVESLEDLKALVVVDDYLAKIKEIESRQQIQELLENPDVPLDVIEMYAALSYLKGALLHADEGSTAMVEAERLVYTAEATARHLGWNTEEIYDAIARGDIQAELCVRLSELLRVKRCSDAIRQAGSSYATPSPQDPTAQESVPY